MDIPDYFGPVADYDDDPDDYPSDEDELFGSDLGYLRQAEADERAADEHLEAQYEESTEADIPY